MKQTVQFSRSRGSKECSGCELKIVHASPQGTIRQDGMRLYFHPQCIVDQVVEGFIKEGWKRPKMRGLSAEEYAARQKIINKANALKHRAKKTKNTDTRVAQLIKVEQLYRVLDRDFGGRPNQKPSASELVATLS